MAELTREQFTDQVIGIVRARFPLVKIARADQSFSLRVNGMVVSLENLYRRALMDPDEVQQSVERWAVEMIRFSEGSPDAEASFEELREWVLPMVVPETTSFAAVCTNRTFESSSQSSTRWTIRYSRPARDRLQRIACQIRFLRASEFAVRADSISRRT